MASPTQHQTTCAVFAAALLLGVPSSAAIVVGPDGKPVRRETLIGKGNDGACKVPPGDRAVAFNLARETKLVDMIAWISPIICKAFLVPDTILAEDRRLTPVAPDRIPASQAYRFFLGAMDSVALGVEPAGKLLRIVDARNPPQVVEGAAVASGPVVDPYVTVIVRLRDLSPEVRARVLKRQNGKNCDCLVFSPDTIVFTDLRSNVQRLLGRAPAP